MRFLFGFMGYNDCEHCRKKHNSCYSFFFCYHRTLHTRIKSHCFNKHKENVLSISITRYENIKQDSYLQIKCTPVKSSNEHSFQKSLNEMRH